MSRDCPCAPGEGESIGTGRVNQTRVPCPSAPLARPIVPPINSTSFREIARPRPVPSCLRVSSLPTWRNSSKIAAAARLRVATGAVESAHSARIGAAWDGLARIDHAVASNVAGAGVERDLDHSLANFKALVETKLPALV